MPCLSGAVQGRRVFTLPASFPFLSENDNSSPESKQNRARNAQMRNAPANPLELLELLDRLAGPGEDTENVEPDSLAQRPALANDDHVALLNTESGRDVSSQVLVALLVTVVLRNVVKVLAADDDGAVHLGRDDTAGQDTAADRDHTSEGALLVDVVALNGGLGGLEPQTNVLVPSPAALARPGGLDLDLGVKEDVRLLKESTLALDGQFGGHFVGSGVALMCCVEAPGG